MIKNYVDKIKKGYLILYYYFNLGFRKLVTRNKNVMFLIGSPYKGNNLGDYAIDMAEDKFFEEYLKDCLVLRLPDLVVWPRVGMFKFLIGKSKILIHGGGFLGTLWPDGEGMVRKVIQTFPDNNIYILPQTIYFSNDSFGKECLEESIKIYTGHNQLTIFTRDMQSYNLVNSYFHGVKAVYVPDIVTCLNFKQSVSRKSQVLLCMRADKEKVLDGNINLTVDKILSNHDCEINVINSDNVVEAFHRKYAPGRLNEQFNAFASSKFIVTDRLHGMIFAAITSTPCICMDNKSGKVKGVYEWIKNNNYIRFVDNELDLISEFQFMLSDRNEYRYDNEKLIPYFKKMADIINA
jgi:pyruvyl transferase EpsI